MIYICTHTDFELPEQIGKGYTVLSCNPLKKEYRVPVEIVSENSITPMQHAYAEGYHIRHLYAKASDEWIGINQYRKYFFDIPPYRTVLPIPRRYNMHAQYADAHNINDLLECESIINEYYPQYACEYSKLNLYHCNMFVMRRYDFEQYCDFVFGVLDKFNRLHDLHTDADVYKFVESRADQYSSRHSIGYQSRLQGYLFERIGTIFFTSYFGIINKKIHFVTNRI